MKVIGYCCLLFLLIISGCRKVEIFPQEVCEPIPPGPDIGWYFASDSFYVWGPSLNPRNHDEFVFVHAGGDQNARSLVKYNMVSRTKSILFQGNIDGDPSWGANGWILFKYQGGVVKIREDGSDLTQLTSTGSNGQPKWNWDATKFAYYSNPTGRGFTYLCEPDGRILDTLFNSGVGMSWNHPRYSPYPSGDYIHISDLIEDTIIALSEAPLAAGGSPGTGAIFAGPKTLIYVYKSGIYSINIDSREVKQLKSICTSVSYQAPDYSSTKNKILWLKKTYEPISSLCLKVRRRFVLTDVDMQNEEEIDVDW
jgi:hypothetical protein